MALLALLLVPLAARGLTHPARGQSPTATPTSTRTPISVGTVTATATSTATAAATATVTATSTATSTVTATGTVTVTASATTSPTATGSATEGPTATVSTSATPAVTPSVEPGPGTAPASTATRTTSLTSTVTATAPVSVTAMPAPSRTPTAAAHDPRLFLPMVLRSDPLLDRVARRLLAMDLSTGAETHVGEWAWKGGVGMIGVLAAVDAGAGDADDLRGAVGAWLDEGLAAGAAGVFSHPNHTAPAWVALRLAADDAAAGRRPADRHVNLAERGVRWLLSDAPRAGGALAHRPGQLWDDTLFMSVPLLAEYGARFDRRDALDAAAREILLHAAVLQDPITGLWFHGWDIAAGDPISGAYWARGNGWAALATSEVLRHLPFDHPDRATLVALHQRHLRALVRVQDRNSGMWRTVLDRPDFYLETSGSAAIAAALYRAVVDGHLEREYLVFADQAYGGVLRRIASDGTVTEVSAGTGVPSRDVGVEIYGRIDRSRPQAYGQGLVLMLLAAKDESGTRR